MTNLSKRATIYFDPVIHQALSMRAKSLNTSLSEIMDEAARLLLVEDQEDMRSYNEYIGEMDHQ